MSKKRIEILVLILSLIFLGYFVDQNRQLLFYLLNGKLVKKLDPRTPYEIQIENFKYHGIYGTSFHDDIIYRTGKYEPEVLGFLRDATGKKATENQSVFLDIGANTGWHSVYLSRYVNTVLAVEPYPPVIEQLNKNIQTNNIKNIQVHPVGFSNHVGSFPFYTRDESKMASGSFDSDFFNHKKPPMNLPLVVGDEYLKSRGMERVDLIKIDIEGYERYALFGLKQILKTSRPVVAMELNATEGGFNTKEQLIDTFPKNYQFFRIKSPPDIRTVSLGSHIFAYGPRLLPDNKYYLKQFDYDFSRQDNIAAIPLEKSELFEYKVSSR